MYTKGFQRKRLRAKDTFLFNRFYAMPAAISLLGEEVAAYLTYFWSSPCTPWKLRTQGLGAPQLAGSSLAERMASMRLG